MSRRCREVCVEQSVCRRFCIAEDFRMLLANLQSSLDMSLPSTLAMTYAKKPICATKKHPMFQIECVPLYLHNTHVTSK